MDKNQPNLIHNAIIVALEGTLASSYWRESLKFGASKAYENGIEYDTVVPWVRSLVNHAEVDQIFYLSTAPWYCLDKIERWLKENNCRSGYVCIIGFDGGFGLTKESVLNSEIIRSHDIKFAIDNKDYELYKKHKIEFLPSIDPKLDPKTHISKHIGKVWKGKVNSG